MQTGKEAGEAQMQALGEDWRIIESLLPAGWMEMARELGALRRTRGFADARACWRVMLIHLADGCGLRDTAVRAAQAGLADVSDVALLKRLKSCEHWFEWMTQQMRGSLRPREPQASDAAAGLLGARRVRVVDGSMVSEPGPTGSQWRPRHPHGVPGPGRQAGYPRPHRGGEMRQRVS